MKSTTLTIILINTETYEPSYLTLVGRPTNLTHLCLTLLDLISTLAYVSGRHFSESQSQILYV